MAAPPSSSVTTPPNPLAPQTRSSATVASSAPSPPRPAPSSSNPRQIGRLLSAYRRLPVLLHAKPGSVVGDSRQNIPAHLENIRLACLFISHFAIRRKHHDERFTRIPLRANQIVQLARAPGKAKVISGGILLLQEIERSRLVLG